MSDRFGRILHGVVEHSRAIYDVASVADDAKRKGSPKAGLVLQ
jgi:hypothetical protein